MVEGDSFCAINWASGLSTAPWPFADVVEAVHDSSKDSGDFFSACEEKYQFGSRFLR